MCFCSNHVANAEQMLKMKLVSVLLFHLIVESLSIKTIKLICNVLSTLIGLKPVQEDVTRLNIIPSLLGSLSLSLSLFIPIVFHSHITHTCTHSLALLFLCLYACTSPSPSPCHSVITFLKLPWCIILFQNWTTACYNFAKQYSCKRKHHKPVWRGKLHPFLWTRQSWSHSSWGCTEEVWKIQWNWGETEKSHCPEKHPTGGDSKLINSGRRT